MALTRATTGEEQGLWDLLETLDPVLKDQVSFPESYGLYDYILRISKN